MRFIHENVAWGQIFLSGTKTGHDPLQDRFKGLASGEAKNRMNNRESDDKQIVAKFHNDVMNVRAHHYILKTGSNFWNYKRGT